MSTRLVLILAALITVPAWAAADDLDFILARDKAAAQKIEATVEQAITQSRVLEAAQPEKAVKVLQDAQLGVHNASVLDASQRKALSQRLQARVQQVNDGIRAQQAAGAKPAPARSPSAKPEETPADIAKRTIEQVSARQDVHENIQARQKANFTAELSRAGEGGAPANGAIELSPEFAARAKVRDQLADKQYTSLEKSTLKTLDSAISVDFKGQPFRLAMEYITDKTELPLLIDQNALKETQVDYDDPVTFTARNVSVRTVLKKLLSDRGLGYIVKDGVVQVMTAERAQKSTVTKVYYVGQMTIPPVQFPTVAEELFLAQQLILSIQALDPALWDTFGGPYSITYNIATHSISVRAPAEFHATYGSIYSNR